MDIKKSNNINLSTSEKSQESSISSPDASSLSLNLSETIISPSIKRVEQQNLILDFIRKHSGLSMWELSKSLNLPNSTIYYKVRDLEIGGLIYSKLVINQQHRLVRLLYSVEEQS